MTLISGQNLTHSGAVLQYRLQPGRQPGMNCLQHQGDLSRSWRRQRFSQLIQRLIHDDYLRLHHLERYRHRLSIEGRPLHYYAVVGRKNRDLDVACLAGL
ncbi:MAG: hypothetical protein ACYDAW_13730 [Acidithiobacillus ferrivorans]